MVLRKMIKDTPAFVRGGVARSELVEQYRPTYFTQHIKQSAYTTLVRPLLEYSSSVWDPHIKTLVNKIELVQKRAARFCHKDYKTIERDL